MHGNTDLHIPQLLSCCKHFSSATVAPAWSFHGGITASSTSWDEQRGNTKANVALCSELGNKPLWYCRTNSEWLRWEYFTAKANTAAKSCSASKLLTERTEIQQS